MMELEDLVSGIDFKLRKLIAQNQLLLTENQKLATDIQELKHKSVQDQNIINELEEKNKILKLSRTLETKEGSTEAKVKINELVREIEKCIGLLNT